MVQGSYEHGCNSGLECGTIQSLGLFRWRGTKKQRHGGTCRCFFTLSPLHRIRFGQPTTKPKGAPDPARYLPGKGQQQRKVKVRSVPVLNRRSARTFWNLPPMPRSFPRVSLREGPSFLLSQRDRLVFTWGGYRKRWLAARDKRVKKLCNHCFAAA